MLQRLRQRTARIGIFAVGHNTYWRQFDGLLDRLMDHHHTFKSLVEANDVEVDDYGMVDSNLAGFETAEKMKADHLDLLFCNMVTYATSSTFTPIIRDVPVPMVLAALQPLGGLDFSKASTFMQLASDNICSVPEYTGVALRFG